ncbi:MAG: type II secretion system protein [bacterium]|nr:type II secretion system protein [bacterium]
MKNTARYLLNRAGFTLIELLIVIALIGILAVAVLAAINPIEQLNRARDTGMESDATQLISAIDRYYASQEKFPWVVPPALAYGTTTTTNEAAYGFIDAIDGGVGVCGSAVCSATGRLLAQFELKPEFANRGFVKATAEDKKLYIAKDLGASKSVYACWVPSSKSRRAQAVTGIAVGSTTRSPRDCTGILDGAWTVLSTACVLCIPR